MYWDHLTSPQIDALDRGIPVVLPVAATEQHGPHLPLATDRMIGEHFCRELHQALPQEVLILPPMAVGCSDHHMPFPGTLTLDHKTFLAQGEALLRSVIRHGFRRLLILNSHGGNQGVGQVLLERIGYTHPECKVAMATWWKAAADALAAITETGPGGVGHAGEFETSLMLLIAPDLVQTDKITDRQNQATYDWAEGDMLRGARAAVYRTMKEMTPNGVFGDPQAASAEKGDRITRTVVEALVQMVKDLRRKPGA